MDFVAVDVETANPNRSSICQIGMVVYTNGIETESWESLVNPEEYFHPMNTAIHGIGAKDVRNAPKLPGLNQEIKRITNGRILVCHTTFDQTAFSQAFCKYNIPEIECIWLDSAKVARRTWKEFSDSGYSLWNLASKLNIKFQHHDALEDARAAGEVMVKAIQHTGISINEWVVKTRKR
mgnify:CR=1 FL=1